jgi:hypothetical protein
VLLFRGETIDTPPIGRECGLITEDHRTTAEYETALSSYQPVCSFLFILVHSWILLQMELAV